MQAGRGLEHRRLRSLPWGAEAAHGNASGVSDLTVLVGPRAPAIPGRAPRLPMHPGVRRLLLPCLQRTKPSRGRRLRRRLKTWQRPVGVSPSRARRETQHLPPTAPWTRREARHLPPGSSWARRESRHLPPGPPGARRGTRHLPRGPLGARRETRHLPPRPGRGRLRQPQLAEEAHPALRAGGRHPPRDPG